MSGNKEYIYFSNYKLSEPTLFVGDNKYFGINVLTKLKHLKNAEETIESPYQNTIDKYYTKPSVVKQCIELVKNYINISNNDLIIEPSAGNGSFIENIKTLSTNYKFFDLEPEHNEVHKQDFLEFDYKKLKQKFTNYTNFII